MPLSEDCSHKKRGPMMELLGIVVALCGVSWILMIVEYILVSLFEPKAFSFGPVVLRAAAPSTRGDGGLGCEDATRAGLKIRKLNHSKALFYYWLPLKKSLVRSPFRLKCTAEVKGDDIVVWGRLPLAPCIFVLLVLATMVVGIVWTGIGANERLVHILPLSGIVFVIPLVIMLVVVAAEIKRARAAFDLMLWLCRSSKDAGQ